MSGAVVVVACMKLVELRAGVDPLSGAVIPDPMSAGPSPADEAALEWALRIAAAVGGTVVAVSAGSAESDAMLRGAIAAGAARAARVGVSGAESSAVVAQAIAHAVRSVVDASGSSLEASGSFIVTCGDASLDRGSGSVPAFLAGELGASQALGLVGVSLGADEQPAAVHLEVERRLDGGRRERLSVRPPCIISVEAGTARLRRAPLDRTLAAGAAEVQAIEWSSPRVLAAAGTGTGGGVELVSEEPFRPRTRVVPPPPAGLGPRERILGLTGSLHGRPAARTLVLEPELAADELLSTLAAWGELPEGLVVEPPSHDAAASHDTAASHDAAASHDTAASHDAAASHDEPEPS
jgi:electron transfer flavoprotein beta subunit